MTPELGVPEDTLPDGWRVLWCPDCGYSITFSADEAEPFGDEWRSVMAMAIPHEHPTGADS